MWFETDVLSKCVVVSPSYKYEIFQVFFIFFLVCRYFISFIKSSHVNAVHSPLQAMTNIFEYTAFFCAPFLLYIEQELQKDANPSTFRETRMNWKIASRLLQQPTRKMKCIKCKKLVAAKSSDLHNFLCVFVNEKKCIYHYHMAERLCKSIISWNDMPNRNVEHSAVIKN